MRMIRAKPKAVERSSAESVLADLQDTNLG